ncbi:MAG: Asp-tRNA(Asn)/Glu-tRNA(Gln) amidotransferase subunit GatC [Opitutales bacterium]|nr:Asp-tRNA(Asn)/Glu-tRNA(Gln) amidotransferase subunit GatC [Opitutales bacterium]NRA26065.1 Asp-tRNA(Asn)/Glu-tRNA(Gln) amidotransferase subunit GatC [Opitutales bacterium]
MSDDPTSIDIEYVAKLARIELSDDEKSKFSTQLHDVLEHFKQLNAVNVEGIEPTAHAFPLYNVWQEDVPQTGFTPDEALKNAPAKRANQLIVPKVIEDA